MISPISGHLYQWKLVSISSPQISRNERKPWEIIINQGLSQGILATIENQ